MFIIHSEIWIYLEHGGSTPLLRITGTKDVAAVNAVSFPKTLASLEQDERSSEKQ